MGVHDSILNSLYYLFGWKSLDLMFYLFYKKNVRVCSGAPQTFCTGVPQMFAFDRVDLRTSPPIECASDSRLRSGVPQTFCAPQHTRLASGEQFLRLVFNMVWVKVLTMKGLMCCSYLICICSSLGFWIGYPPKRI